MPSSQIKTVSSFAELVSTPFADGVNALCWSRELDGDFAEVVSALGAGDDVQVLSEPTLLALTLSPAGALARDQMLGDLRALRERDLDPVLNCIHGYPRDEDAGAIATDVFSWHVDSATTEADTWLCSYAGDPSEGLPNEQAIRRVDIPETRAALLEEYGGADDEDFQTYLSECCYDLHYVPTEPAQPYSFGRFNLWRIATQYPDSPVLPCIHRAPATRSDQPRLLLIA